MGSGRSFFLQKWPDPVASPQNGPGSNLFLPRKRAAAPPQETVVGFAAMFLSCLGPAAWVLGHLEDYKKRE
uniref:COX8A oxidase n=1 Tax=Nothoprocta perdicaria TaxID=30464 RepID=A0A8C6YU24_NOTPE